MRSAWITSATRSNYSTHSGHCKHSRPAWWGRVMVSVVTQPRSSLTGCSSGATGLVSSQGRWERHGQEVSYLSTLLLTASFAETHSLWSKRCWWRASSQSSSSSLVSALKTRLWDPSGDGLMTDSLLDFWPDHPFSITRIRVSCSTKISRKITAQRNETSLTLQKKREDSCFLSSTDSKCAPV